MSVATSLRGVLHHLDVHVRIPLHARGLVHHPQHHHPPMTRPSPISRRLACSRPRRTRSRTRTERALCSNIMSRRRLASLLLGGGFTFSRVMSKSVRSRPSFLLYSLSPCSLRTRNLFNHAFVLGMPVDLLHIHRQSAYLIGRDRTVTDIPLEHPSSSKQHAVIQCTLFFIPFYCLISSRWAP